MANLRPLSSKQERKLVDYISDKFLDITRNYKMRTLSSSSLPTLFDYLSETHTLLLQILQIPPITRSQTSLRTALLLRLTGDALSSIPGYALQNDYDNVETILRLLLAWLDDLDKGWSAVLRRQAWDPEKCEGIEIPTNSESSDNPVSDISPVNQTERTRLRSLIISGTAALEEWLEATTFPNYVASSSQAASVAGVDEQHKADNSEKDRFEVSSESESDSTRTLVAESVEGSDTDIEMDSQSTTRTDFENALVQMGLQQAFDELFSRTLREMGELSGEVLSTGEEIAMS